jgi:hypothetical protein
VPGDFVAFSPSSPRQVLSRRLRPAGVAVMSQMTVQAGSVSPPIGFCKRCVSVASPVASALKTPKSVLKSTLQSMRRAVWREKSKRLTRLLHPRPL